MKCSRISASLLNTSLVLCGTMLCNSIAQAQVQKNQQDPQSQSAVPPSRNETNPAHGEKRPDKARAVGAPGQQSDSRSTTTQRSDAADDRTGPPRSTQGLGARFDAQPNQGLTATSVEENSPAFQAGLRRGDRIVSANGYTFVNDRQFQAFLASQREGHVPVIIEREGKQYTVQLPTFPQAAKGAWLGVFLEQGEDGEKGVKVTRVYPAGPAARAGIRTGDAIIQVDGNRVEDSADLISVIQQFEGGATANITVVRDEQEMKIPVLLGVRGDFMEMQPPRTFENNAYAETANGSGQHAQYRTGRMNPADGFDDIPPYAMQLEHDRRVAEQHERIESEIRQLREEIRQLREQLRK